MRVNSNQNNYSFKSRIAFVSSDSFYKLLKAPNVTIADFRLPHFGSSIRDTGKIACDCIAPKTIYGFTNSSTRRAEMTNLVDDVDEVLDGPFGKLPEGTRAMILDSGYNSTAGRKFDIQYIKALMKKTPTTIFWGQESGYTLPLYDLDNDIWFMQRPRVYTKAEDLKMDFDCIHIAEGDTVVIGGKEIDPKRLNQNKGKFYPGHNLEIVV